MKRSRRAVVRACGATAAACSLGSLAGCSSLPAMGSSPSDEGPWYASWIPAPGALGQTRLRFDHVALADVWQDVDETGIEHPELLSFPEIAIEDVEHYLFVGPAEARRPIITVVEGSFDPEPWVQTVGEARGLSEQGTRAGYTIYDGASGQIPAAVAVSEGRIVQGFPTDRSARETLVATIETAVGETRRFVDADEATANLVDALGDGDIVGGRRHDPADAFGDAVGQGTAILIDGARSTFTGSVVFERASDVSQALVAEWAVSTGPYDSAATVTVETDGPVATVEAPMETSAVDSWFVELGATGADTADRG